MTCESTLKTESPVVQEPSLDTARDLEQVLDGKPDRAAIASRSVAGSETRETETGESATGKSEQGADTDDGSIDEGSLSEYRLRDDEGQGGSTPVALIVDFFRSAYEYREYIRQSVARDLRHRYKRSVLGYVWSMLNPLLMMMILTVVFANLMQQNITDYAVFLISGMLPFNYFSITSLACLGTIRSNARIIDQLPVPKTIFPLSIATSGMIDFLLSLFPLILVMLVCRHPISLTILALPLVLIPMFFVTMGVSLTLAAANVFFEDTQHLSDVMFRALYFLSPVLYARHLLPEWIQPWVALNPMFPIIEYNRGIFYDAALPPMGAYLITLASSTLVLAFGLWVFRKTEQKFVYFL